MKGFLYLGLLVTLIYHVEGVCKDIDSQACQAMKAQNSEICFDPAVSTTACPKFCNKCAIDSQACQAMKAQNSEICFDPAVSTTACPKFCNKCALTCYSCTSDVSDPSECKTTKTCQPGEHCLTQRLQTLDGAEMYTVSCARPELCDGLVGKRDLSISCCSTDLCNGPIAIASKNVNMTATNVPMATTNVPMATDSETTTEVPTTTMLSTSIMPTTTDAMTTEDFVTWDMFTSTPTTTKMTTEAFVTWDYFTSTPTTTETTTTLPPLPITSAPKNTCARDLIFVVDESATMSFVFSNVKQFIADIVAKQTIGYQDTRVSMTTFALTAKRRWDLNSYNSIQPLLNAILTMKPRLTGISDGISGLNYVIDHVVQSRYGDRPDVPDVVVFISDGGWHNNLLSFITGKNDQLKVTSQLHLDSHDVIAIGIGPANTDMIHSIATDNVHSFMLHRAVELLSIEQQVLSLICQG